MEVKQGPKHAYQEFKKVCAEEATKSQPTHG